MVFLDISVDLNTLMASTLLRDVLFVIYRKNILVPRKVQVHNMRAINSNDDVYRRNLLLFWGQEGQKLGDVSS